MASWKVTSRWSPRWAGVFCEILRAEVDYVPGMRGLCHSPCGVAPCLDRVTGKKKKKRHNVSYEVHENIYLNVTKLKAVTILPPGTGRTFSGFQADGQRCQPIARGVGGPRKTGTTRCGRASLRRLARRRDWGLCGCV